MASSVIILTNQPELTYTSNPVKGDGYYGFADGLHTVSFHVANFTGRIHLEATIVDNPSTSDWFPIDLDTVTPYLEFNANTTTVGTSFEGNFVYLRVIVDRDYLGHPEYIVSQHGIIDKAVILL